MSLKEIQNFCKFKDIDSSHNKVFFNIFQTSLQFYLYTGTL